jgi:hypothetical protein
MRILRIAAIGMLSLYLLCYLLWKVPRIMTTPSLLSFDRRQLLLLARNSNRHSSILLVNSRHIRGGFCLARVAAERRHYAK